VSDKHNDFLQKRAPADVHARMKQVSEPAASPAKAHIMLNSSRSFCPFSPKGAPDAQPLAVALADALSVGKHGEHGVQAKDSCPKGTQGEVEKRRRSDGDAARRSGGRTERTDQTCNERQR
jgi:hypothetical protein